MRHLPLILLILLFFGSCQNGQPLAEDEKNGCSLKLYMEPESPMTGNEIHLYYEIKGRGYSEILYPKPQSPFGGLEILSWETHETGAEMVLLPLKAGEYSLPGLSFFLDGEESFSLQLPEVQLSIPSQLSPDSSLQDASSPVRIGLMRSWQWVLLFSLILLVLILLFVFFFHRTRKNRSFMKVSRELELRIERIDWDSVSQEEQARALYRNISYEIRYFCDKVFYTRSLEKTSGEFQGELLNLPVLRQVLKPWFIEFWNRADKVKYAAETVSRDLQEEDIKQALALLKDIQRYQKEREEYESA